jgi:hypothetical protein
LRSFREAIRRFGREDMAIEDDQIRVFRLPARHD